MLVKIMAGIDLRLSPVQPFAPHTKETTSRIEYRLIELAKKRRLVLKILNSQAMTEKSWNLVSVNVVTLEELDESATDRVRRRFLSLPNPVNEPASFFYDVQSA